MIKTAELRELTTEELEAKLHELKEELFTMRLKKRLETPSNPLRFRTIQKEIARVKTIQKEKESVS